MENIPKNLKVLNDANNNLFYRHIHDLPRYKRFQVEGLLNKPHVTVLKLSYGLLKDDDFPESEFLIEIHNIRSLINEQDKGNLFFDYQKTKKNFWISD